MPKSPSPYDFDLDKNPANYQPLTPLGHLERAAWTYPDNVSVIHGDKRLTWKETHARAHQLADALSKRGIGKGDTVAVLTANTPEMMEMHFGIPMTGAVINTINTRLDAAIIGFILDHGEAKALITDTEFAPIIKEALKIIGRDILVIDIADPQGPGGERLGKTEYYDFIAEGDADMDWSMPDDEWNKIALNYTSGTTGNPKGVVFSHRGAYLNSINNALTWGMPTHARYLWTLPMFHCNGWCFPWTITMLGGTHVCLRQVRADAIYDAIADHKVDHLCGAPIVLNMIVNAADGERRSFDHQVEVFTAGAPPAPATLAAIGQLGFNVTQVYGLTETYGHVVESLWNPAWDALPAEEQSARKARQGIAMPMMDLTTVVDDTGQQIAMDGVTQGEIVMRGRGDEMVAEDVRRFLTV